jgi:hypothetical protein
MAQRSKAVTMDSELPAPKREADIWARLMREQCQELPRQAAEFLLSIDLGEEDRRRMLQLADRSEAGTLTAEEREEFDSYLHVRNFLAIMQSKARVALGSKPRTQRS